jgi:hypothetical protein
MLLKMREIEVENFCERVFGGWGKGMDLKVEVGDFTAEAQRTRRGAEED